MGEREGVAGDGSSLRGTASSGVRRGLASPGLAGCWDEIGVRVARGARKSTSGEIASAGSVCRVHRSKEIIESRIFEKTKRNIARARGLISRAINWSAFVRRPTNSPFTCHSRYFVIRFGRPMMSILSRLVTKGQTGTPFGRSAHSELILP